ncbi:hypothetical protein H8F22_02595 [Pseudomonas sp. P154a]|uniref:hypothetical protein n=1 Tax=Pseudomonas mucoides TaxID=2730424 RepID=UPI00189211EA|nr:hypothetical protein [Pseudomonas mucoides]MBF6037756.1 hypothetical protein [Pseudomonas mucoides]
MRIFLGITGTALFAGAVWLAYCLLQQGKFSGTEFVAFVIAFAVIALVLCFGQEVQEFTIAGSVVKLKEIKNDALKQIEALKRTRVELLRLLLRAKSFVSGNFSFDADYLSVDPDFWDIVAEARRNGSLKDLAPEVLKIVDVMIPALYAVTVTWGKTTRPGDQTCETFVGLAIDLMNSDLLKKASLERGDENESIYKNFVEGRVLEIEKLFALKRELSLL